MDVALVHLRHARTGGTERFLNHLAARLAERGDRVTIVCRRHEDAPHPAVRFAALRGPSLGAAHRMLAFARAVERHAARTPYDVVVGLGKTWTHDVVRLGGGCHATYLERAHAATLRPAERLVGWGRAKQRAALAIERRALEPGAYAAVVVNAAMVGRDASTRYGIPPERLRVVHNGVDLERFHPRLREGAGAAVRREAGVEADAPVALFLGTGYGRKGLDLVLEAWPRVARARPAARLLVVGYDRGRPAFEARARRLGVAGSVRFLGGRRDPEACHAAADVFVLPTRYDPFANATLEALASGVPAVTTEANGAHELVEEGASGSVLPAEPSPDALAEALAGWLDPARREAAGAAARALAERHPIEAKLAAFEVVLDEAAAERERAR